MWQCGGTESDGGSSINSGEPGPSSTTSARTEGEPEIPTGTVLSDEAPVNMVFLIYSGVAGLRHFQDSFSMHIRLFLKYIKYFRMKF